LLLLLTFLVFDVSQDTAVKQLRDQINGLQAESDKRKHEIDIMRKKMGMVSNHRCAVTVFTSCAAARLACNLQYGPHLVTSIVSVCNIPATSVSTCGAYVAHVGSCLQVQANLEKFGPLPDHSAEIQQLTNQQTELREQVGSTVLLQCS
jgi:hypothetical protein